MTERPLTRAPRPVPGAWLWGVAQWVGLAATVALIAGLVWKPEETLAVLWYGIVPLLPLTFLLSTQIWRNVCPIATLNTMTGDRFGDRRLAGEWFRTLSWIGLALLVLMVPARRFLFNVDGPVLAFTIAATGVLALLGGLVFDKKAAFCNGICPVLPVERLYGQRPLVQVPNARCAPCRRCTMGACLDLVPGMAAISLVDRVTSRTSWMRTPFGLFALAFPGFVIGYSLLADAGLASAGSVYGAVALAAVGSLLILGVGFALTGVEAATGLLICAGLAAGFYYWYTPAAVATAFGLSPMATNGIRAASLLLVSAWLVRSLRPDRVRLQMGRARS